MSVYSLARLGALSALLALPAFGAVEIDPVPVEAPVYSANPYKPSPDVSVTVEDPAGVTTTANVGTHLHTVSYPDQYGTMHTYPNAYYTHFSFGNGYVNVHVALNKYSSTCAAGTFTVAISPQSYGITGSAVSITGNVVSFTMKTSRYLMMKVTDKDGTQTQYPVYILILADPLETDVPAARQGTGIYNIVADGQAARDNSADVSGIIQTGINQMSQWASTQPAGTQGIVFIPYGVFRIAAPIHPARNVKVYLEPGSYLRVAENLPSSLGSHLYVFDEPGTTLGSDGYATTNFKIYGRGTIDANSIAAAGYPPNKSSAPIQAGPVRIRNSSGITLDGIVLREANTWSITFDCNDTVKVMNTKVVNYTQDFTNWRENDGFDLAQCSNSVVSHGFVFTADDAACFKGDNGYDAGTNADQLSTDHSNNVMYDLVLWTGADGCRFGGEMRDPVSYSYFKNVDIIQAQRALGIHATEGGATFDHIGFTDIRCETLKLPPKPLSTSVCRPIDFSLQISNSPLVTNMRLANVSISSTLQNSIFEGDGNSTFNGAKLCNLTIGSVAIDSTTALDQFFTPAPDTTTGVYNVTYPAVDWNVVANLATYYTNNFLTGTATYTVDNINDTSTSTLAHGASATTNNGDAVVTYEVPNIMVTSAEVNKPSGSYNVASWQLEAQDPATGLWTTLFTFGGATCPTTGWNAAPSFPATMASKVRLTFRPPAGGTVGIAEVHVFGH